MCIFGLQKSRIMRKSHIAKLPHLIQGRTLNCNHISRSEILSEQSDRASFQLWERVAFRSTKLDAALLEFVDKLICAQESPLPIFGITISFVPLHIERRLKTPTSSNANNTGSLFFGPSQFCVTKKLYP